MKKLAILFVLAILGPSLALAWMAFGNWDDQETLLTREREMAHSNAVDRVSDDVADYLDDVLEELARSVDSHLAAGESPSTFPDNLSGRTELPATVVFALIDGSELMSSSNTDQLEVAFHASFGSFLTGRAAIEHYRRPGPGEAEFEEITPPDEPAAVASAFSTGATQRRRAVPSRSPELADTVAGSSIDDATAGHSAPEPQASAGQSAGIQARAGESNRLEKATTMAEFALDVSPDSDTESSPGARKLEAPSKRRERVVLPEVIPRPPETPLTSAALPTRAHFEETVRSGLSSTGYISVLEETPKSQPLRLLAWCRRATSVFGFQVDIAQLGPAFQELIAANSANADGLGLAILDHRGSPVAAVPSSISPEWRRPYIAAELGAPLPRWEAASYIRDDQLESAARDMKLKLAALTVAIISAILFGGLVLLRDVQRQVALAKQKSDFVSSVSHELKTPLTSIRMFSDLLCSDIGEADPGKTRRYAQVIGIEAARLTRLIENVLDFARIERGDSRYHFRPMELASAVEQIVANSAPQLAHSGFKLRCENLSPEPLVVNADQDALNQVLVNLLSNCEKYGRGDRCEVLVTTKRVGENAVIEVCDRGPGIPDESADRIFDRFYRAGEPGGNAGSTGSGLGLAIAKEIVKAHDGRISYSSRDGGGSRFLVQLPLVHPEP